MPRHPIHPSPHRTPFTTPSASNISNISTNYNDAYLSESDEEEHYIYETAAQGRGTIAIPNTGGAGTDTTLKQPERRASMSGKTTRHVSSRQHEGGVSQHPPAQAEASRSRSSSAAHAYDAAEHIVTLDPGHMPHHIQHTLDHRLSKDNTHAQSKASAKVQLIKMQYDMKRYRFFHCVLLLLTSCLIFLIGFCILFKLCLQRVFVQVDQLQIFEASMLTGFGFNVTLMAWNPNVQPLTVRQGFFNISVFEPKKPSVRYFVEAFTWDNSNVSRIPLTDPDMDDGVVKRMRSTATGEEGFLTDFSTMWDSSESAGIANQGESIAFSRSSPHAYTGRKTFGLHRLVSTFRQLWWRRVDVYKSLVWLSQHGFSMPKVIRELIADSSSHTVHGASDTDDVEEEKEPVSGGITGRFAVSHFISNKELQKRKDYSQLAKLLMMQTAQTDVGYHIDAQIEVEYGWIYSTFKMAKSQMFMPQVNE